MNRLILSALITVFYLYLSQQLKFLRQFGWFKVLDYIESQSSSLINFNLVKSAKEGGKKGDFNVCNSMTTGHNPIC